MESKDQKAGRKPSVVYDLSMPSYRYRDDRGEARTVGADRPKSEGFKMDCLANLTFG